MERTTGGRRALQMALNAEFTGAKVPLPSPVDWEAMSWQQRAGRQSATALGAALMACLIGCGTPGAPQPPSLRLPEPVHDLTAQRAGDKVTLTWTAPRRNTDNLLLKDPIEVRVCHSVETGACESAGTPVQMKPATAGAWTETLPAALTAGQPRVVRYFVELRNHHGRSAGESNAAVVLAGAAPAPLQGLTLEERRDAVALHWTATDDDSAVRLQRTRLGAPAKKEKGLLAPEQKPAEIRLLVKDGSRAGGALDKSVVVGEVYEYRAQRVTQVDVDGKTLELAGEWSTPLRVQMSDIFPPATPTGLAAVGSQASNGETSIDLSWQPNSEADVAGYIVYRSEGAAGWQRISPAEPVAGPAFHDTRVVAGHTYTYAVSAIDRSGHESARSVETQETAPNP